jgi:hypothetical protein
MTPKHTDGYPPATEPQSPAPQAGPVDPQEAERQRRAALGEQAWAAFQRDWPQLAQEHYGQWVVYQGDRQLGIARTRTELYQACFRRGLQRGEFHVFGISHPLPDNIYVDWPIVDR